MSKFFDDTMQGLLEAVAINQKQIPVQKVDGLQADTFRAEDIESNLIDSVVKIRKESNISHQAPCVSFRGQYPSVHTDSQAACAQALEVSFLPS